MSRLQDKVLVVTGASSGIGAATALAAARAGMDVVLAARRPDRLLEVAREVERTGRQAEVVVCDVADRGATAQVLDAAEHAFGRFDAVFANAGYGFERTVLETDDSELRAIFEVNFFAAVELLRESANRLQAMERPGHLLMCSSCLAKFTLPLHSAYSATKAAQAHVCRAMRHELAPHGIEVSSVHPVTTTTEFFEQSASRTGRGNGDVPAHAPKWLVQRPEDVARAVVRCLERPCPEVWTSLLVRLSAGLLTAFPWMFEPILRREAERSRRAVRADHAHARG
ncbi:MAG: SDR family NAD(P)-dependent oxidoreductase [Phycisphaerales bacterium]|nr:SDR family NAD(P)-dependent oxidoreductase [Phycisphaerales bacterium]